MKVEVKQQAPAFTPMQVVIDVETEEDAQAIYAMFNYFPFTKALGLGSGGMVRADIGEQYYVATGEIARGVTTREFYGV